MALQKIILEMEDLGLSATRELGDGRWCHTPDYFRIRYGRDKPARAPKVSNEFKELDLALGKLTPAERILLLAKLEE